jgi:hypothetical protein
MKTTLTLTNGNVLDLSPSHDPRIKDSYLRQRSWSSDGYVRILTKTQKGCAELVRELQAWGAGVDKLGGRCLIVNPAPSR